MIIYSYRIGTETLELYMVGDLWECYHPNSRTVLPRDDSQLDQLDHSARILQAAGLVTESEIVNTRYLGSVDLIKNRSDIGHNLRLTP